MVLESSCWESNGEVIHSNFYRPLGLTRSPWISAPVVTTLVLGVVLIISFCIWERITLYPMFPRELFQNKVFTVRRRGYKLISQRFMSLTLFIAAIAGANFGMLVALWPIQCAELFGPDPLDTAKILSVCGFSIVVGIVLVNWAFTKFHGAARELMTLTSCVMTLGLGLMALINKNTPSLAMGLSAITGLGVGGLVQPTGTLITIISPDALIATIIAATIAIRTVGGTIGYAIYFNILQTRLVSVLPENLAKAAIQAGLSGDQTETFVLTFLGRNTTALAQYPMSVLGAAQEAVKGSYTDVFRTIYLASIGFSGAAIIASLLLPSIRKYMVDRVAVDIR